MKVLVTGHTGFIGTNLFTYLGSLGHEVVGCSRREGCNLLFPDAIKDRIKDCELVYHLAAEAKPAESLLTPWETFEINTKTTMNVGLLCKDFRIPLVYVSSCEIYGDSKEVITEQSPIMPTNPYAASKAASDRLLYSFYRCYALDVRVLRLFNPYGPHQQLNKIIPTFYRQAKKNHALTVFGEGKDTRDYVYVEDIVRGLWDARKLPAGETVNLATGVKTTNLEVAQMIIKKLGSTSQINFTPYPEIFGGIKNQVGSFDKAAKLMGWTPRVPLKDGLDLTLKWLDQIEEKSYN